jgi:hypothetical protein
MRRDKTRGATYIARPSPASAGRRKPCTSMVKCPGVFPGRKWSSCSTPIVECRNLRTREPLLALVGVPSYAATSWSAVMITSVTACGCEIMITWEPSTSVIVAPAR